MGDQINSRFSDEKLAEFHAEFKAHVAEYKAQQRSNESCVHELIRMQQQNTEKLAEVIKDTKDLVQLQKDFQGAARLGGTVQKVILSCVKWGAILLGMSVVGDWAYAKLLKALG